MSQVLLPLVDINSSRQLAVAQSNESLLDSGGVSGASILDRELSLLVFGLFPYEPLSRRGLDVPTT